MSTTYIETATTPSKPKTRKVRRACSNCQGTHAKCSSYRPCLRCIGRRCEDTCTDSPVVTKPTKYAELKHLQPVSIKSEVQDTKQALVSEQFFRFMDNIDVYIDLAPQRFQQCEHYGGFYQM